jgi:hypothetical protein
MLVAAKPRLPLLGAPPLGTSALEVVTGLWWAREGDLRRRRTRDGLGARKSAGFVAYATKLGQRIFVREHWAFKLCCSDRVTCAHNR